MFGRWPREGCEQGTMIIRAIHVETMISLVQSSDVYLANLGVMLYS